MNKEERLTLQLYSRPGCHLCEQMLDELSPIEKTYNFIINVVDISDDEQLIAEYAGRIPVLVRDARTICEYFLDEQALLASLE